MAQEQEIYLGVLLGAGRNLPKPTIAQVQGKVICRAASCLLWPCDLIVASEDATFSDPVVAFGVKRSRILRPRLRKSAIGKPRKCCSPGDAIGAAEGQIALAWSTRSCRGDPTGEASRFRWPRKSLCVRRSGLKNRQKMAVNQSLDAQGMWTALQAAFSLHSARPYPQFGGSRHSGRSGRDSDDPRWGARTVFTHGREQ